MIGILGQDNRYETIEREMRSRGLDPNVDLVPDDLWPQAVAIEMQARRLGPYRRYGLRGLVDAWRRRRH